MASKQRPGRPLDRHDSYSTGGSTTSSDAEHSTTTRTPARTNQPPIHMHHPTTQDSVL